MAETKVIRLQGILAAYAENLEQVKILMNTIKDIHEYSLSERDIERNIAGMIHDGLEYGNWPWTKY